jgi:L-alanine-DL-glutamate epimerase-like enolase superfamily enzyme
MPDLLLIRGTHPERGQLVIRVSDRLGGEFLPPEEGMGPAEDAAAAFGSACGLTAVSVGRGGSEVEPEWFLRWPFDLVGRQVRIETEGGVRTGEVSAVETQILKLYGAVTHQPVALLLGTDRVALTAIRSVAARRAM